MKRSFILKNPIAFVFMILSLCCVLIVLITTLRLPELTVGVKAGARDKVSLIRKVLKDDELGKFGEMMIEMLPEDLAFTVFIPSEKAFERELSLRVNESFTSTEKMDDTYAVISRILGFSAVPRTIYSTLVDYGSEIIYDAVSGFTLNISKDRNGRLVVNGVRSEMVDLKKKDVLVHIMDGVIMDASFEQSVKPDDNED
ncbi:uncharacterized protein LOC101206202 [Cucumis sativus]|uniref:FAS1 domain-containing protein n=1 Tax=Cucumis sativus TaxID=3659 RepID=A0A0A0K8H5_CUCSA|nr:uncharacterized protein LOC101206202 [Cucumis sativus]KGN45773.1 hypothetical protein Csa_005114 [Cucumis sativus]